MNLFVGHILRTSSLLLALLFTFISSDLSAQDALITYKTYCAGCHGAQLEGGSAGTLIKTDWGYGRGKGALRKNIKFGIPGTDMVAWGKILKDEEINSLVDFMVKAQTTPIETPRPIPANITTKDYILKVEQLDTDGLKTPWGIEFADPNRALITERGGSIRWLINDKLDLVPIQRLPPTHTQSSTGGYMDLALDPNYKENGWVYLAFSYTNGDIMSRDALALTKIVRGRIEDHQWIDQETVFEVADSLMVVRGNRWGGRLLFDRDGFLYFTIGDMAKAMDSQDLSRATGKVFRIHPDGTIPKDNPFISEPNALTAIYTIGNRNTQGLAQHPETGELWSTDHGPMGGDELNILRKGANYGWPVITYGVDYSGDIVSEKTHQVGMEQPIFQWTPSIGICPAEFITGPLFEKWKNSLMVGSLAYEELYRLVIQGNEVAERELLMKGVGRVRDIKTGPDGALYVLLNNPDKVLRITPVSEP